MLKVGITGGIGSGKTLVASIFHTLGIPVYDADAAAKRLMNTSTEIREQLTGLFGADTYKTGQLDRPLLASKVFGNPEQLGRLNAIVHPVTIRDSQEWFARQTGPYAIKEAAIFFESGSDQYMDYMIGVTAPEALRIRRTMDRSHITEAQVRERMQQQMDDAEKMRRCHFVIDNGETVSLIGQVMAIHEQLKRM
ncbi:dephospho-CoA kinase [Niabella drilacis]|uniref:Dephospho-CoA kinase n=1 Tax=Niabella drilacis (strain DSM 25811 / CCM 8410 / CCUG 62505 / LMG 26954 / E90) TaxID=1285928 RepID=A0A1G6WD63_NIADE|nr:dephospho-CoA kinase [Niabella drilacis]SDD63187.1 dephospho-CoA kinase [Niabella drilacis]